MADVFVKRPNGTFVSIVGLIWKGEWDSSTAYVRNNAVTHADGDVVSCYRCAQDNTNQEPSDGSEYWDLIASGGLPGLEWKDAWNSATAYAVNDAVSHNSGGVVSSYRCIQAHTNQEPPVSSEYWVLLSSGGEDGSDGSDGLDGDPGLVWRGAWSALTAYEVNNAVSLTVDDVTSSYRCLQASTNNNPASSPTYWTLIASGGEPGEPGEAGAAGLVWKDTWSGAVAYAVNDAVQHTYDSILSSYRCIQAHTNQQPGATTGYWELIALGGEKGDTGETGLNWLGPYNYATTYQVGDAVSFDPVIGGASSYICIQSCINKVPPAFPAYWQVFAGGGEKGDKGDPGTPGTNGIDGQDGADGSGLTWRDAWNSATAYEMYDAVYYDDGVNTIAYFCIQANTNKQPDIEPTYWVPTGWGGAKGDKGDPGTPGTNGIDGDPGLVWKDAWDNSTSYDVNDAVYHTYSEITSSYRCIQAHSGQEPGATAGYWAILAAGGTQGEPGDPGASGSPGLVWQGAWNSGTAYSANDAVSYEDNGVTSSYICLQSSTNNIPLSSPSYWELLASGGTDGTDAEQGLVWKGTWDSGTTYAVNDAVSYAADGVTSSYICIQASTNNIPSSSPTYWDLLASGGEDGAPGTGGSDLSPVGSIVIWPINYYPDGWLPCLGQSLSRVQYAALFAVIGTTYGLGDSMSETFRLPNFSLRMPVGVESNDDGAGAVTSVQFGSTGTTYGLLSVNFIIKTGAT